MPARAPTLCNRCRQPTRGPCTNCNPRATLDQTRGSSTARGYGHHWRTIIRPNYLRRHPLCILCQHQGRTTLATIPDHWPETRRSLTTRGVTDPDADHRLRPLCTPCHNQHGLRTEGA